MFGLLFTLQGRIISIRQVTAKSTTTDEYG